MKALVIILLIISTGLSTHYIENIIHDVRKIKSETDDTQIQVVGQKVGEVINLGKITRIRQADNVPVALGNDGETIYNALSNFCQAHEVKVVSIAPIYDNGIMQMCLFSTIPAPPVAP